MAAQRKHCLEPGPKDSICLLIPKHWGDCVFTPYSDTPMAKREEAILNKYEEAAERARVRQEEEERVERAREILREVKRQEKEEARREWVGVLERLATGIETIRQGKLRSLPRRIR